MYIGEQSRGWDLLNAIAEFAPEDVAWFGRIARGPYVPGEMRPEWIEERRQNAWVPIREQLLEKKLFATGFAPAKTEPVLISTRFLECATPRFVDSSLEVPGTIYGGVRIYRMLPPNLIELGTASSSTNTQASGAAIRKDAGGAPAIYPWDEFVREIVRATWNGEFSTRLELQKAMRRWCDANWATAPDDRTIKRRIDTYCPPEISPR